MTTRPFPRRSSPLGVKCGRGRKKEDVFHLCKVPFLRWEVERSPLPPPPPPPFPAAQPKEGEEGRGQNLLAAEKKGRDTVQETRVKRGQLKVVEI